MENHPSRKELIEAARQGLTGLDRHLQECESCRLIFGFFRALPAGEAAELPSAPSSWIERAGALTQEVGVKGAVRKLRAKLSFDSWSELPAVEMRSTAVNVRRMSFDCGDRQLEIQGSRRAGDWQFVARFSREEVGQKAILRISGERKLYADEDGYFIWASPKPVRSLTVEFRDEVYAIKNIEWKINEE